MTNHTSIHIIFSLLHHGVWFMHRQPVGKNKKDNGKSRLWTCRPTSLGSCNQTKQSYKDLFHHLSYNSVFGIVICLVAVVLHFIKLPYWRQHCMWTALLRYQASFKFISSSYSSEVPKFKKCSKFIIALINVPIHIAAFRTKKQTKPENEKPEAGCIRVGNDDTNSLFLSYFFW